MSRIILEPQAVERALKREGVQNPIIDTLERYEQQILAVNASYNAVEDNSGKQQYIRENFGFLGDAFEDAGDFSVAPLDLIAIWSKACDIMGLYQRYDAARMLSLSYSIIGGHEMKGLSRYRLENDHLPPELQTDKERLSYVKNRLVKVRESVDAVDFYVDGTDEPAIELAVRLTKRTMEGDAGAKRQLDELIARHEERTTPVLGNIGENFANGILTVRLEIEEHLSAFQQQRKG